MQFYLIVKYLNKNGDPWKEKEDRPEVTTLEEAEAWGKETINRFNETLHPGEAPRKYVGVEKVSDLTFKHDWEKTNLMTISDRTGMYDTYRCAACGITAKRYGIGGSIHRDRKFKAEKYSLCAPDRSPDDDHS